MQNMSFIQTEDYQELIEDIVRDGRLYASENHQEILKVGSYLGCRPRQAGFLWRVALPFRHSACSGLRSVLYLYQT